ncbi:MAG: 2-oxoacid:acceptor oxidoreductase family protein [Patescibacteria group bacterium]
MAAEISIRWHSRAGQGAITVSTALAEILGQQGKFVQSFPDFGAEKRGAPVVVFNRISSQKIDDVSHPTEVDAAVLLDPSLIASCEITPNELLAGLKKKSVLLINTAQKALKMGAKPARTFAVAASEIAVAEIGKDIPNVPILGALIRILGLAEVGSFLAELKSYLETHLPAEILAGNLRAFERGFAEVGEIPSGQNGKIACAKLPNWQAIAPGGAILSGQSKHSATGDWTHQTCEWNPKTCINCNLCWPACPHSAILIKNAKMAGVNSTKCTACALCVAACPTRPKSLQITAKKSVEI